MILKIITDLNPILHKEAKKVTEEQIVSKEMQKLAKNMIETMYAKDGVGLAAVQVDEPVQLFVIAKNFNTFSLDKDLILFNPTWTKTTLAKKWDEEGCLSVPGIYGQVKRYTKVKVRGLNSKGESVEFAATDFFARIVQHETDHLNGHLFIEKAKNLHELTNDRPL